MAESLKSENEKRDEVLARMLAMGPKPHKPETKQRPVPVKKKSPETNPGSKR